jgi:hypothetical protein
MGTKSGDFAQQDEVERLCKHLLDPTQPIPSSKKGIKHTDETTTCHIPFNFQLDSIRAIKFICW